MPRRRRPSPDRPSARADRGSLYPTLDLHGETADGARRLTESWLRQQSDSGERLVRIITGRGKHSVGPPVLRAEIEAILRDRTDALVASFEAEAGGGALRVVLRPASPARSLRPPPAPRAHDPQLRRAAEEALSELGIDPAPELVDAEIRRIRAERQGRAD